MSADTTSLAVGRLTRLGYRAGFWAVAYTFLVAIGFTTVPAPLWVVYAHRDDLSSLLVTVAFGVYSIGVVTSLFLAGHVSDWYGRKRVLLPAVGLEVVAAIVFLAWDGLPGLLLARLLSGFGAGALIATATVWVNELHHAAYPEQAASRADRVTTALNVGGLGFGALASGVLAQWSDDPLTVPYAVFLAALVLAVVLTAFSPETHPAAAHPPRYRPQRVAVPEAARARFLAAAGAAFLAFAALGLFASVASTFLAETLHHTSHALAGATTFAVFAAGVLSQELTGKRSLTQVLLAGSVAMPTGLAVVVIAVWLPSPSLLLFLVGGVIAGAGVGLLFKGALVTGMHLSEPAHRAEALAGLFLAGYVGLALPVVGLGVLSEFVAQRVALLVFAAVLAAGTLVAAPALVGRKRG